jgi:hypothetical protein
MDEILDDFIKMRSMASDGSMHGRHDAISDHDVAILTLAYVLRERLGTGIREITLSIDSLEI